VVGGDRLKGNFDVILCEQGSKPSCHEVVSTAGRVDLSHGAGTWELVTPKFLVAIMAGADGLMVEDRQNPDLALSDGF